MRDKLNAVVQAHNFSGVVLVVRSGERLLAQGYGMADLENNVPNALHTKFRIGSITKTFTAMAVMILAEQGKLQIDNLLSEYLPDIPDHWRGIALHHLLSNTSGILHVWELPGFSDTMSLKATSAETIQKVVDRPLVAPPGTKYHYSGTGFFVLSRVIERVSGQSYRAFLKAHIFDPIEMADTGCDHPDPILPHRARVCPCGEWRGQFADDLYADSDRWGKPVFHSRRSGEVGCRTRRWQTDFTGIIRADVYAGAEQLRLRLARGGQWKTVCYARRGGIGIQHGFVAIFR